MEKIRGLSDEDLKVVTNEQLIIAAMALIMDFEGCEDKALIEELRHRVSKRLS